MRSLQNSEERFIHRGGVQLFSLAVLSDSPLCLQDTPWGAFLPWGWGLHLGCRAHLPFPITLTSHLLPLWTPVRSDQCSCPGSRTWDLQCGSSTALTPGNYTSHSEMLLLPLSGINHFNWKFSMSAVSVIMMVCVFFCFSHQSNCWFLKKKKRKTVADTIVCLY